MHTSLKYAEGPEARPRRVSAHGLLTFTASFCAVILATACLLDLIF